MRTVYPQPGYSEADLKALIASRQFVYVDCYTIVPLVGAPLTYTTDSDDVTVVPVTGGIRVTYRAKSINVSGLKSHTKIGVEVDTQQIRLDYPGSVQYQARLSWPQALKQGLLISARIRRDRFYAATWTNPMKWVGGVTLFDGIVTSMESVGRQTAQLNVNSDLWVLSMQMPRALWETGCKNILGDAACGVDLSSIAVVGTVTAGTPTEIFLPWTTSSSTYGLGKIEIANFDSCTRVRTVLKADATGIWLVQPLDFVPVVGQSFTAYPGCNRTLARCQDFHPTDFRDRIKAFPFVPVAQTAM